VGMGLPRGSLPNLQPGPSGFARRRALSQTELPSRPTLIRPLDPRYMRHVNRPELRMKLAD
jgi:hypothetical protein